MTGIVFDIQKFSLYDGPGIRTTVFLKGCMMRCIWCHNPESFSSQPQLSYNKDKCTGCRACEKVCQSKVHSFLGDKHIVEYKNCKACGSCITECPTNALKIIGKVMGAEEVIKEVLKDKNYYDNSSGGVTFSGGEATLQFEFLLELLKLSKEKGLHVCLETNGVIENGRLEQLLNYVDLFLFDYKATGAMKHKRLTGVDNKLILENLEFLAFKDKDVFLRCPIIPGINDETEHFEAIKLIRKKYRNIKKVEIMGYHNIGSYKWSQLGLEYTLSLLESVSSNQKLKYEDILNLK